MLSVARCGSRRDDLGEPGSGSGMVLDRVWSWCGNGFVLSPRARAWCGDADGSGSFPFAASASTLSAASTSDVLP